MKSPNFTNEAEIKGIIHDTNIKSFESIITINNTFMTNSNCSTAVEVEEIIHDTIDSQC